MSRGDFFRRSALIGGTTVLGTTFAGYPDGVESAEAESEARKVRANTKVVLLGVGGGPIPKKTERGISQAIVVGESVYLVDCGTGIYDQLYRAGLIGSFGQMQRIRNVFLTHLHVDHTADYFTHLLLGWPRQRVDIFGPGRADRLPREFARPPEDGFAVVDPLGITPTPGVEDMTRLSTAAFAYVINARMREEGLPPLTDLLVPHDIELPDGVGRDYDYDETADGVTGTPPAIDPFVVVPEDDNGVTVTATLVNHAPVFPAFAYRFDTPDGSIVVSGDTSPSENLIKLARDADILVHEVLHKPTFEKLVPQNIPDRDKLLTHVYDLHTSSTDVGKVARDANVDKLVLTHFVPGDRIVPDRVWRKDARENFGGEVIVGRDLMEVGVTRSRPAR